VPTPLGKNAGSSRASGYSSAMLIHESRILQVAIFGTLHKNLSTLDFNLLLPDVMIIADEVDAQLTQTMDAFTKATTKIGGGVATRTLLRDATK
jgi:hypothetical protein